MILNYSLSNQSEGIAKAIFENVLNGKYSKQDLIKIENALIMLEAESITKEGSGKNE